jgi:probable phosphoglycerate mutase
MNLYCIRHGETEWSLSGQHTGVTDISLTDKGRDLAKGLRAPLSQHSFSMVLVSPLKRAMETCALAGLADDAQIEPDLREWNYGDYEGLTPAQIRANHPGWILFRDGCPNGETPEQMGQRVDRIISRVMTVEGDVALFAHGHVLRTLAARWIGLPPEGGMRFLLDTGTLCILGFYRDARAIKAWNAPLV